MNRTTAIRTINARLSNVQSLLKYTYSVVPITAGLDKFTHLLTNWNKYLSPIVMDILPLKATTFMHVVGVVEIVAGALVLIKPKIGSLIVAIWLVSIVINLLLTGQYFDIAVRDAVMAIGALALSILSGNGKDKMTHS